MSTISGLLRVNAEKPHLMTKLALGDLELFSFVENRSYIDGGSMYGVIPKKLWSKLTPCDENNLVPLDMNVIVIKAHGKCILVDCGLGDVLTDRERKLYGCTTPSRFDESLHRLGLSSDRIDFVIPTHLHLDHVGGAFALDGNGDIAPKFPNARHIIRRQEWDVAMNPDDRSRAAYPSDNLRCLENAGLVEFVDSDIEILNSVKLVLTGGHTAGHQAVVITSGDQNVICCADMIPTIGHLRPEYIASSDLFPLDTLAYKKKLLEQIVNNNWIVAFDHDLEYKFAKLRRDGNRIVPDKVGEPFLAVLKTCEENRTDSHNATG